MQRAKYAPMSSSGSVRLRYEKCLEVWGNASFGIGNPHNIESIRKERAAAGQIALDH